MDAQLTWTAEQRQSRSTNPLGASLVRFADASKHVEMNYVEPITGDISQTTERCFKHVWYELSGWMDDG